MSEDEEDEDAESETEEDRINALIKKRDYARAECVLLRMQRDSLRAELKRKGIKWRSNVENES